jgi:hypothetical protein
MFLKCIKYPHSYIITLVLSLAQILLSSSKISIFEYFFSFSHIFLVGQNYFTYFLQLTLVDKIRLFYLIGFT